MKNILLFIMLLSCISIYAQDDNTVVEVHMKGSKREIIKKLENASFVETKRHGKKCMVGPLAGDTVEIYITNKTVSSQTIKTSAVKIFQVLDDGRALARVHNAEDKYDLFYGPVVMVLPKPRMIFYDDLIVDTGRNGVLKIVDSYTYMTQKDIKKTVPVVEIPDK